MVNRFHASYTDSYPYELAAAVSKYRVWDPDYGLFKDPQVYDKMLRDAVIAEADDHLTGMVAGRDWYFEAATDREVDRRAALFMEQCFKKLSRFTESRKLLATAYLRGSRWAKVEHAITTIRLPWEAAPRKVRAIVKLHDKPKENFRLIRTPETSTGWTWQVYDIDRREWIAIDDSYMRHSFADTEASLGYGRGLCESLYWTWTYKVAAKEHGLDWLERWARGDVVIKTDLTKDATKNVTTTARLDAIVASINRMRKGGGMAMSKDDDIQIVDPPGTGYEAALKFEDRCNQEIKALILGEVIDGSTATYASAMVLANSRETKMQLHRDLLDESIDTTLAARVWRWNRVVLVEMGLGQAERPAFRIRQEKRNEPKDRLEILKGAVEMGLEPGREDAFEELGLPMPVPGQAVISRPKPETPGIPWGMNPPGLPPGQPQERAPIGTNAQEKPSPLDV